MNFEIVCTAAFAEAVTEALPVVPRLVVTRMTPFAPRTPNTAVAEASLRTEMLSISLGSSCEKERSTPSTRTSGSALFREPTPRMRMTGSSAPGMAEGCTAETPGRFPWRAFATFATGAFIRPSPLTAETAPVMVTFFCWPYAMTTDSSNAVVSGSRVTVRVAPVTWTSWVA